MTEKVYSRQEWGEALEEVKGSYGKVYVPSKEGDFHVFKDLKEGAKADFSYGNTRMSAKGLVYPQSERMFEYRVGENILREAEKDYEGQAVVGIRPCDAGAFLVVKRNFDTEEYRDPWWVKRYESTTLVGFGCVEPCGSCFCSSVGGGPFSEKGLDVLVTECGEEYVVRGLTEKGEAFLSKAGGGREAEAEDLARAEEVAAEALGKVVSKVETDKLKEKVQTELFDAPFWEEVAFGCINCGTCTYVCPTCWCFDIQDEVYGGEGDRIRNWDSCMFPLFTLHGSGHNPREEKVQRVRQRFMHKLKYYVDKYGEGVQCTGCGRCVRYCPVNIDIRRVCGLMNEY